MPEHKLVELTQSNMLSPSVRLCRFRTVDGTPLSYRAGQWLNFEFELPGVRPRSYSLASAPDCDDQASFDIAVTRVENGPASELLHRVQPGFRCRVDGPWGVFVRRTEERARPALFVGTGTGLSPLRAMLQQSVVEGLTVPTRLLFGCRGETDILWREEFETWTQELSAFSYVPTLSASTADWSGCRGYVQSHLEQTLEDLQNPVVYVCGLRAMVDEVRRLLKERMGFHRQQIRSERFD